MKLPYYDRAGITIYHADCRELLPTLAARSIQPRGMRGSRWLRGNGLAIPAYCFP